MWLSDRRVFLTGLASALAACGFQPVYGPEGGGNRLLNRVTVKAPETRETYLFTRRFEERLGRGGAGGYGLSVNITTNQKDLGSISSGEITRYRINGTASFVLSDANGTPIITDKTRAFTGYSTTGSTVATLSAERDAVERLMVILADQVIDALLLASDTLPE